MTKRFQSSIFIFTIFLLTSCGDFNKERINEKETVVRQEQLNNKNENAIINLTKKHNAVLEWDTLDQYTYLYQEMFIDQGRLMGFVGELNDITKTDGTYLLKVQNSNWLYNRIYIALISLSREKFIEFQKILQSNKITNEGCFIFKVSKIISSSPGIKSNIILNGEDSFSYLYYDLDESLFIFKGELIDLYLNKRTDEENDT